MRITGAGGTLIVALVVAGCGGSTAPGGGTRVTFRFSEGPQGWTAGLADYLPVMEMMFVADYRRLQAPLTSSALYMTSVNRSDDAFMYYKRQVPALTPNAVYGATFTVTIATNVPRGCGGAGGQPGESVFFKAGASAVEPIAAIATDGHYRMNIDIGNQSQSGANAVVIGNVAGDLPCEQANFGVWRLKTLTSASNAVSVRTNPDGSVWLIVGTDSGFEGPTSLYITEVDVTFQRTP